MTNKKRDWRLIVANLWYGFRAAMSFPLILGILLVMLVGIVLDKELLLIFLLLMVLNLMFPNRSPTTGIDKRWL